MQALENLVKTIPFSIDSMYNKPILVILRNKTVLQASIVKFVLLSATRIMLFLSKLSHISYGNQESLLVYSTSMCRWHANPKAKFWDDCLVMFTHWDRIWILVLSCVKRFEWMTHYQIFYFLGKQILKLTKFSNNSFVGTVFIFCSLYTVGPGRYGDLVVFAMG